MGITRRIAMNLLNNRFHMERDCLNNCILQISNGFYPPSVLIQAKLHTQNINTIVAQLESLTAKKKDDVVAKDYWDLMSKANLS